MIEKIKPQLRQQLRSRDKFLSRLGSNKDKIINDSTSNMINCQFSMTEEQFSRLILHKNNCVTCTEQLKNSNKQIVSQFKNWFKLLIYVITYFIR